MMCGMCPDVIDGCYHDDCIRRGLDGQPLKWYVDWKTAGDRYCVHLAAKYGHKIAEWQDKYRDEDDE